MEVICLHDASFYALRDKVMERFREKYATKEDKWISGEEALEEVTHHFPDHFTQTSG